MVGGVDCGLGIRLDGEITGDLDSKNVEIGFDLTLVNYSFSIKM